MFIQAFDGSQYCCVNDKDIYALEEIPEHETKIKRLRYRLYSAKTKEALHSTNEPLPGVVNSLENLSNSKNTTRMIKIQKLPEESC
ncbi:MAG: hypothetical protein ACLU6Y_20200 [Ruminococcus sp.]